MLIYLHFYPTHTRHISINQTEAQHHTWQTTNMCVFLNLRHHCQPSWCYTHSHTHSNTHVLSFHPLWAYLSPFIHALLLLSSFTCLSGGSWRTIDDEWEELCRVWESDSSVFIVAAHLSPSPGTPCWLVRWAAFSQSGITPPRAQAVNTFSASRD